MLGEVLAGHFTSGSVIPYEFVVIIEACGDESSFQHARAPTAGVGDGATEVYEVVADLRKNVLPAYNGRRRVVGAVKVFPSRGVDQLLGLISLQAVE